VIEANTPITFRADSVADKLGTLLNEDSAEQVRHLANYSEKLAESVHIRAGSTLDNLVSL